MYHTLSHSIPTSLGPGTKLWWFGSWRYCFLAAPVLPCSSMFPCHPMSNTIPCDILWWNATKAPLPVGREAAPEPSEPSQRSLAHHKKELLLVFVGQMMINVSLMYPICIHYKVHYCKVLISSAFEAYYACFKPGPAHPECSKCPKLPECSKCPKRTSQSALACQNKKILYWISLNVKIF